jgi:hypothetical protein
MTADPYQFGVLTQETHERLVANLSGYAFDAGIQPHWIYQPLPKYVSGALKNYLLSFRRHHLGNISGLVILGQNENCNVDSIMSAMCGVLVRNFIRARVATLGTVLDMLPKGEMPDLSCLLIPNFYLTQPEGGGKLSPWQTQGLLDYLTYRSLHGLQTVLYATSLKGVGEDYGAAFRRLITSSYLRYEI